MLGRRSCMLLMTMATAGMLPRPAAAASLRLPRDHGSHPETAVEWWYLTGLLGAAGGGPPSHGFQLTFFRVRRAEAQKQSGSFAPRQLLLAHAALSELAAGRLRHDQRLARQGFAHASAGEADTALRLGPWQLRREQDRGSGSSSYVARLDSPQAGFGLDLQLAASRPPLLQGEAGLSRKGPGAAQFSHYISEPQLQAQGQLRIDGRALRVRGRAWLDHEWSDALLGSGADAAVGWDWLGINLHDGGALTLFQLRRADGSRLWAGGSWRRADGSHSELPAAELGFQPGRRWRSAVSQAEYPVEWALQTPLGRLSLRALFDAQEVDARRSTGMLYWEGAARLADAQGRELGLGYLEMTGYSGRMSLP
ncbi:lipocalin-like domain-containing protein [Paucibacter sediminis]|uniref:Lipocalin-like domain-containing protein n=1 Tax=Paucibacter sediminis TaxID=3019553 RepID=A0AA95NCC4_9BURK|nr:lipocalin-like domain-containing protein [Paucibacter sp. S2-9]WIT11083.1 lipocalin-like domain-containing protein [Paucibacter sp. S2-9]